MVLGERYAEELGVFYENKIRKLSNDNDKH